jgi:hypothetical protein
MADCRHPLSVSPFSSVWQKSSALSGFAFSATPCVTSGMQDWSDTTTGTPQAIASIGGTQWLSDMPLGADTVDIGFSYYDKETFFHRRHISANTAELTEADQLKIRQALADYVNEAGALTSP